MSCKSEHPNDGDDKKPPDTVDWISESVGGRGFGENNGLGHSVNVDFLGHVIHQAIIVSSDTSEMAVCLHAPKRGSTH